MFRLLRMLPALIYLAVVLAVGVWLYTVSTTVVPQIQQAQFECKTGRVRAVSSETAMQRWICLKYYRGQP